MCARGGEAHGLVCEGKRACVRPERAISSFPWRPVKMADAPPPHSVRVYKRSPDLQPPESQYASPRVHVTRVPF
ncbi:unnamed protein product, partial [Iphiclides podalirius]